MDQGGDYMSVSVDKTGTIRSQMGGHAPIIIENHPCDSRVKLNESGIVQTLTGRMGTGGGNTPMIIENNASPSVYSIDSLGSNAMKSDNPESGCRKVDTAETLTSQTPTPGGRGGNVIVAPFDSTGITSKQNASKVEYGAPCHTLQVNAHPPAVIALEGNASRPSHKGAGISDENDPMYTLNTVDRHGVAATDDDSAVVRRLTPKECERLQGFPDDWTKYGQDGQEVSDSKRYAAIGNSVAIPCVEYIFNGITDVLQKKDGERA